MKPSALLCITKLSGAACEAVQLFNFMGFADHFEVGVQKGILQPCKEAELLTPLLEIMYPHFPPDIRYSVYGSILRALI